MSGQHAEHLQELIAVKEQHPCREGAGQNRQLLDDAEICRQERADRGARCAEHPALAAGGDFQAEKKLILAPGGREVRREDDIQACLGAGVLPVRKHRRAERPRFRGDPLPPQAGGGRRRGRVLPGEDGQAHRQRVRTDRPVLPGRSAGAKILHVGRREDFQPGAVFPAFGLHAPLQKRRRPLRPTDLAGFAQRPGVADRLPAAGGDEKFFRKLDRRNGSRHEAARKKKRVNVVVSIQTLLYLCAPGKRPPMHMKLIAIANQKGGVGKTTTAVSLSACLAELGWRVLLIDLDPQANATSALGLESAEGLSLYRALVGETEMAEQVLPTRIDNLFIIPADLDLAGAEVEVARLENHLVRLREVVRPIREDAPFDFVLMDCPPSLGILMTNALAAADELLVPIQCEYFALEGLSKIVQLVGQIRDCGANPELAIGGILMTMFDSRTNLSMQVVGEVRRHFEAITYQTAIPRTVRLGEAPSFGKTILEYDGGGVGAKAYRRMAEEFIQRQRGEVILPRRDETEEAEPEAT